MTVDDLSITTVEPIYAPMMYYFTPKTFTHSSPIMGSTVLRLKGMDVLNLW